MSDRSPNHHRTTRRAIDRATTRAIRRGNADAQWLSAIAAGTSGCRY
jgi:hypothetical protein